MKLCSFPQRWPCQLSVQYQEVILEIIYKPITYRPNRLYLYTYENICQQLKKKRASICERAREVYEWLVERKKKEKNDIIIKCCIIKLLFYFILFYFICVDILPLCISAHNLYTWFPWRPEDGFISSGTGVIGMSYMV